LNTTVEGRKNTLNEWRCSDLPGLKAIDYGVVDCAVLKHGARR